MKATKFLHQIISGYFYNILHLVWSIMFEKVALNRPPDRCLNAKYCFISQPKHTFCRYSKKSLIEHLNSFKLMGKKIITILH